MSANFETQKNRKAFLYTTMICGALLLLAILISWKLPQTPPPIVQELIEINLGNTMEGYGQVQPLIKGEKSPGEETAEERRTPVAKAQAAEETKTDDAADKESAPVTKPVKTTVKTTTPAPPVVAPTPKPQKPKIAGYSGPKDGKGNGATEDNGYKYQGNNPNGKGDAGDPNGKPDSYGKDPGGKSGVSVVKGVSPLNMGALKFEDDFNENAKVFLEVHYASSGNFVSAGVAKGTTATDPKILSIARKKVALLKFPSSPEGGTSIILLNFRVQ